MKGNYNPTFFLVILQTREKLSQGWTIAGKWYKMNEADVFMDGIEVVVDDIEDEGLYDFKIIDFEEGAEEVGAEGRLGGEARLQWEWHDLHPTHESLVLSVTLLIVALVSTFLLLRLLRRRASPVGRRDKSHLEGDSDNGQQTI